MAITKLVSDSLGAGVGGKVLQVVQGTVGSSSFTTSSTTLQDTGFNVSITPTSTSSKIYVSFQGSAYKDNTSTGSSGVRGQIQNATSSTNLWSSDVVFEEDRSGAKSVNWTGMTVTDTPNSTSEQTYKLLIRSNISGQNARINAPCFMYATEVQE